MTFTQYEARFVDFSRDAAILIPIEREKVQRFIKGLTYGISLQMAREAETETSFTQVVEISRRIERNRGQATETTSRPIIFDDSVVPCLEVGVHMVGDILSGR